MKTILLRPTVKEVISRGDDYWLRENSHNQGHSPSLTILVETSADRKIQAEA